MKHRGKRSNNRIYVWILGLLVVLAILSAAGIQSAFPTSLALEQAPRCGLTEHVHIDDCYVGDLLLCEKKMHTHTENCYLVLLEDNDINHLLSQMDATSTKSLETLIRYTVVQTTMVKQHTQTNLDYGNSFISAPASSASTSSNSSTHMVPNADPSAAPAPSMLPTASPSLIPSLFPSVSPSLSPTLSPTVSPSLAPTPIPSTTPGTISTSQEPVTSQEIAQLNAVASSSNLDDSVVLNENLTVYSNAGETPSEQELLTQLLAANAAEGIRPLALGGSAGNSDNTAYFFVNLNDENNWIYLGELPFSVNSTGSGFRTQYTPRISTSSILSLLNTTLGITVEAVDMQYSDSADSSSWAETGASGSFTTFGTYPWYNGEYDSAKYVRIAYSDGVPIIVYSVEFQDEDGTVLETYYVPSGNDFEIPEVAGYASWVDAADDGVTFKSGDKIERVTKGMVLKAQSSHTVIYQNDKGTIIEPAYSVFSGDTHTVNRPSVYGLSDTSYAWLLNDNLNPVYRGGETVTVNEDMVFKLAALHTVSFVDSSNTPICTSATVVNGASVTLPDGYIWTAGGKEYQPGSTSDPITEDTSFVGTKLCTVTYQTADGTELQAPSIVKAGETVILPAGYIWTAGGKEYQPGSTSDPIINHTNFVGTRVYTVTYIYADSTSDSLTNIVAGTTITLPATKGSAAAQWSDGSSSYAAGSTYIVNNDITFRAIEKLLVTYVYADRTETIEVDSGSTIRLPNDLAAGYVWVDSRSSANYEGGSSVTITGNTTFLAQQTLTITYNLNFPSTDTISTSTTVTIPGYNGPFSATEVSNTTVLSPSHVLVVGTRRIENSNRNCVAYFEGWTVSVNGETKVIRAGTKLTWSELQSYASSDGTVTFTGDWNTQTNEIARFFVRLDSTAADYSGSNIDTSSSKYTGEIFTTYVGGNPKTNEKIEDDTPDNSYTADQEIRSLLGEQAGTWLYSLPSDEDIFATLKQYTSTSLGEAYRLRFVDASGNTLEYVQEDELDSNHYAIRWYVFKHESDGWHIDGRLVKKEGVIHVEKTFAGDQELIEAGKNGFYITADHSDSEGTRKILMKLDASAAIITPSGTTETITPYSVSEDGLTYIWHIEDVEYNEAWTITEHRTVPENVSVYTEYSIYDSKGVQSAISRYGTTVSVTGVTYAPDEENDHILRAEFRNFYLKSDSIAIKKEDGKSGQPISGATFELWQQLTDVDGNKSWVQLKFRQDGDNLVFDQESGTITQISTGASGYSEIVIEDFSYEAGPVLVREVDAPAGYIPAPEIVLQHTGNTSGIDAEIATVGGEPYTPDNPDDHMYAEYYPDERVLVVKNYSQTTTVVTAKKTWDVPDALQTDSVTVELYANGVLASSLVPSIEPIVELTQDNGYTYTWIDMPTYINGAPVTWTLKEIKVGDEELTVNGSFVNWIDSYNRYETRNSDGELTDLTLEVTNDIRRTMLKVEKTDETGLTALSGAIFQLTAVDNSGSTVSSGYNTTASTDATGWAIFDNLTAGFYQLTEETPPTGYLGLNNSVYLYVDASGKIKQATLVDGELTTLADNEFTNGLSRPSDFTVRVPNQAIRPLPETGGEGTIGFTVGGLLLMAAALLMLYQRSRRKEETPNA